MSCVNVTVGLLNLEETDFSFPGFIPFALNRSYRSNSAFAGMFGFGWGSTLGEEILTEGNEVILRNGEGRSVRFPMPSLNRPIGNPVEGLELSLEGILDRGTKAAVFRIREQLPAATVPVQLAMPSPTVTVPVEAKLRTLAVLSQPVLMREMEPVPPVAVVRLRSCSAEGSLYLITRVDASGVSIEAKFSTNRLAADLGWLPSRSRFHLAAAALKSVPSWNFTPSSRWKT